MMKDTRLHNSALQLHTGTLAIFFYLFTLNSKVLLTNQTMKKLLSFLSQDSLYLSGLILIVLSALNLNLSDALFSSNSMGGFFICYVFSVGYMIAIPMRSMAYSKPKLLKHTVLMLILWFISAFALNRHMNVFDMATPWLSAWIVISIVALLLSTLHEFLPKAVNSIVYFFLGTALLLFTYYAIYLVPLYLISTIGLIAIGISMHTYIPLFLSIATLSMIMRMPAEHKKVIYLAFSGFMVPVLVCACLLYNWNATNREISSIINQQTLNESKLPMWVAVSRQLRPSFLTERILKSDLVYTEVRDGDIFFSGMPSRSFDEQKQHDPLVVIASLLFKKVNLDENERIKVLASMYNARHQAQDRLWRDDDLETVSVISIVKLFPAYRMAYTEKILTISNDSRSGWSNQEAIYTFHLQEGAAVSSLSLWINGKEEKSRLSTKSKADSAYQQIVGVENRDPSVVHWQEGNTITVRVFPCTTAENRKFKIGITSPLSKQGDQLVYENAFFEGPSAKNALETVQVSYAGEIQELELPSGLEKTSTGVYAGDRNYEADWQITCKAPELAPQVFTFAGSSYEVEDYKVKRENFDPETIYLDLNSAWSAAEFDSLWQTIQTKPVYVYDEKLIRLTANNRNEVYRILSKQNFSIFPLQEVRKPETALIISKSTVDSPGLGDLKGSAFGNELSAYCKTARPVRLYTIGYQLSPYLKALKEFRAVHYSNGTLDNLKSQLLNKQFPQDLENAETVLISSAAMTIRKVADSTTKQAPDHLLRLFAYNDIMKKVGSSYFTENYVQPDLIAEADQAYIVSPVSSLIVLETKQDYERFGIEESKNSLKNASMKSSGAVPEPHEWMLIILGLCVVGYTIYTRKFSLQKI